METFAEYILSEKNLVSKIEIAYYLSRKTGIFFDKSVILKTEVARQFIKYMKLDVDENIVLTACLLCNCKKKKNVQKLRELKTYALEGALYLRELGFDKRFCKICEEVNRYSESTEREKESDILELVDQFGGMILSREERIGMKVEEALVMLQHRNLKDVNNRYLNLFIEFVEDMETIELEKTSKGTSLTELVKIENEAKDLTEFMRKIAFEYGPRVDKMMKKRRKKEEKIFKVDRANPNRALFSIETTRKILKNLESADTSVDE